ncbi:MAG: VanW family protein [Thermomicrobiales bacterium]|nr:VanW family protein [Thermomicrobiales bacterium]
MAPRFYNLLAESWQRVSRHTGDSGSPPPAAVRVLAAVHHDAAPDAAGDPEPAARARGRRIRPTLAAGGSPVNRRAALLALGGGGAALAFALRPGACEGRLRGGTIVAGVDLGGRPTAEAAALLRERLASFLASPVTFQLGDRSWRPTAGDIGLAIDYDATLAPLRRQDGFDAWADAIRTVLDPNGSRRAVPVSVDVDFAVLRAYLRAIGGEAASAPGDARLAVAEGGVTIVPARDGAVVDIETASEAVVRVIRGLEHATLPLPMIRQVAAIQAEDLREVRDAAVALTTAPVSVRLGERGWSAAPAELLAALVLPDDPLTNAPWLDPWALSTVAERVAAEVDHPSRNATLGWSDGLHVIDPGYAGVEVDRIALAERIAEAATTPQRTAETPVIHQPAAVRPDNLGDLGITTSLASASSSFVGSSPERAANVAAAARNLSPALIPPHAIFSFNAALGPISLARGYVQGKIILGDWFASDIGGGVCQVSTTVFRAALLAGLPFAEWHPHSFRLGFYELDGWSAGMDAAIYQAETPGDGSLDLQFVNPTDDWLLLQMGIEGERLTAEVVGPATGYEVRIDGPKLGASIPPPAPIERVSAALAPGQRELAQIAQPGVVATMRRRVRRDGTLLDDATFVSPYQPQAEVTLVGPAG